MSKIKTLVDVYCAGSSTQLAEKLTFATGNYYTVNQVSYWIRTDKVPAEHMIAVASLFGISAKSLRPDLFGQTNNNKKANQ